jgi:hypothetical protein
MDLHGFGWRTCRQTSSGRQGCSEGIFWSIRRHTMKKVKIDCFDYEKLKEARFLIGQVYDYYSGEDSNVSRRLETILKKTDYLIDSFPSK